MKKDKKAILVGWIYVIAFLIGLSIFSFSVTAFTPYSCQNSANVYDTNLNLGLNLTLWKNATGTGGTIDNVSQGIRMSTTNTAVTILSTNITPFNDRNTWGVLGSGGCFEASITFTDITSGTFGIGLNNSNIFTGISIPATDKGNVKAWRDGSLIYYSWNTTANQTRNVYNFTPITSEVYPIRFNITSQSGAQSIRITSIWINQTGILYINASDETLSTIIPQPLTLQKTDNISTTTITHANTTLITNYDRASQIHFSGTPYADRTYNLPEPTSGITYFNAYLINKSLPNVALRTFTVSDGSPNVLDNVQFIISKLYGTSLVQISDPLTNFQGQVQEYMDSSTNYNFNITKAGYQNKTFNLYPADLSYLVILYSLQTFKFNNTQGDITYSISPVGSVIPTSDTSNFTLTTNSPSGYLTNFGVSFNRTQNINSSTTTGGTTTLTINTTPLENQTIIIKYFMYTQVGLQELNQSYYLYSMQYGNNESVMGVFGNLAPQINPLYRFLIALFISLIVGAGFFVLIGPLGASGLASFIFLAFGFSGFIPWYLPTITVILVVLGYIAVGGPDGT